ncbi:uncharacterized protein N7529_008474 [Penicillium soppii]|jgi:hypothetical protein|uniref:uncharacterized protein n=1 Tax=Penicillium soppii TaxID=69789 RepID=UPI0025488435|nr:uncharacterized protein N7529_008474 [Penicillium soppii]KAJ5861164.1 hypothetical protein N7529_008474 [Penicillium soppii]
MSFSPIPSYLLGGVFLAFGLLPFFSAEKDYEAFGLPLEQENETKGASKSDHNSSLLQTQKQINGSVSPLAYARGIRDATYGLTYLLLQAQGQEIALTTFTAIVSITAVADALIVARFGGESRRGKIWGHLVTGIMLGGWAWWRV